MSGKAANDKKRWERFRADPDYEQVATTLRRVVDVAGLDRSTIGEYWGVTVHVNKKTFLRVNCADYALFYILDPDKPLHRRRCHLAVLGAKTSQPPVFVRMVRLFGEAVGRVLRVPVRSSGFGSYIQGSEVVICKFEALDKLLAKEGLRADVARHVAARPKKVFASRHNPFTTKLFDQI